VGSTPYLNQIAKAVTDGKCILFLGAGIHAPPPKHLQDRWPYPEEQRPPLGSELNRRLVKKLEEGGFLGKTGDEKAGDATTFDAPLVRSVLDFLEAIKDEATLGRTSLRFEKEIGRMELVNEVKDAVDTGKEPSPVLRALAEIGFPLIATTNYDKLLDTALTNAGCRQQLRVYDRATGRTPDYPPDDDPDPKRPFVFKIHGDIDARESIVITDEDYIQFIFHMAQKGDSPLPETFLFYFKRWTTLFVGYSLLDYNLRILFKSLRWQVDQANMPAAYSVDQSPDPLIEWGLSRPERMVTFVVEDIWKFVPELYRRVMGKEMPNSHGD
jgi:hypothetical protein